MTAVNDKGVVGESYGTFFYSHIYSGQGELADVISTGGIILMKSGIVCNKLS